MDNETKLMGLDEETYNALASRYSSNNIFYWIAGGVVWALFHGYLVSWATLLLILPGMFIISYASIPFFYVEAKKHQTVPNTRSAVVLGLFTLWNIFDFVYPIALGIGFVSLLHTFL